MELTDEELKYFYENAYTDEIGESLFIDVSIKQNRYLFDKLKKHLEFLLTGQYIYFGDFKFDIGCIKGCFVSEQPVSEAPFNFSTFIMRFDYLDNLDNSDYSFDKFKHVGSKVEYDTHEFYVNSIGKPCREGEATRIQKFQGRANFKLTRK